MSNLYWLEQIQQNDYPLVGGQAFALSQLLQDGYPVVPGFVIATNILEEFLETLGELEPLLIDLANSHIYVNVDDSEALQLLAQQICQAITAASIPPEWLSSWMSAAQVWQADALILRPCVHCLNHSSQDFVGWWESQVCFDHDDSLESALKQTWSELFRASSLFYFQRQGIALEDLKMAILVQPLHDTIASGNVSIYQQQAQIQATWGLEKSLTTAEVMPDSYRVQLESGTVQRQSLGQKISGYRLNLAANPQFLERYLLSETQQNQYVLEQESITQLTSMAQSLSQQVSPVSSWQWTLSKAQEESTPKLQITQVDSTTTESSQELSWQGLAASPGIAIAPVQVILNPEEKQKQIPPHQILVTNHLTPDWLPLLKQAAGIITEQGSLTSHAAILARELGIPAVVSIPDITQLLTTGELVRLDGERGEVMRAMTQEVESTLTLKESPQAAALPLATRLMLNISQPSSLATATSLPVDGIGLLRSELMMLNLLENQTLDWWLQPQQKNIFQENLTQLIQQFVSAFAPRPIFYRSCDWYHQRSSLVGKGGTLNYYQDSTLFDAELAALVQLQRQGANLKLILPFVRSVAEFRFCYHRIEQAGLLSFPRFEVWIMAEVPSVLWLLPEYAQAGVQGIAIGSNDLTQLLLGTNREEVEIASGLNESHPVVLQAIEKLITMAKTAGISCSICGQAPVQYPEIIDDLVRWGIDAISVEPEAVEATYNYIARAEKRLLLEAARQSLHVKQARDED